MAKTKAADRFFNRAARFDVDIELVDVFWCAVKAGALTPADGGKIFEYVDAAKHPRLSTHKATKGNRTVVLAHLKKTLYVAYVKDMYEDLAAYLTDVVLCAARSGFSPDQLIGEHRLSIEANDLLKCGNWDNVLATVAESLFRRLEGMRNTRKLIEALDKKLGLGLDKTIVDAAMPYIELRHLLVHADGVADEEFASKYPQFGAKAHDTVSISHKVAGEARAAITALVLHCDERLLAVELVVPGDIHLNPGAAAATG
jgi:hypothetical protein